MFCYFGTLLSYNASIIIFILLKYVFIYFELLKKYTHRLMNIQINNKLKTKLTYIFNPFEKKGR